MEATPPGKPFVLLSCPTIRIIYRTTERPDDRWVIELLEGPDALGVARWKTMRDEGGGAYVFDRQSIGEIVDAILKLRNDGPDPV